MHFNDNMQYVCQCFAAATLNVKIDTVQVWFSQLQQGGLYSSQQLTCKQLYLSKNKTPFDNKDERQTLVLTML